MNRVAYYCLVFGGNMMFGACQSKFFPILKMDSDAALFMVVFSNAPVAVLIAALAWWLFPLTDAAQPSAAEKKT